MGRGSSGGNSGGNNQKLRTTKWSHERGLVLGLMVMTNLHPSCNYSWGKKIIMHGTILLATSSLAH